MIKIIYDENGNMNLPKTVSFCQQLLMEEKVKFVLNEAQTRQYKLAKLASEILPDETFSFDMIDAGVKQENDKKKARYAELQRRPIIIPSHYDNDFVERIIEFKPTYAERCSCNCAKLGCQSTLTINEILALLNNRDLTTS